MSVTLARGGGLSADYFENVWFFYTPVLSRIDAQINFDWGDGAITPTAADYVSVRWSGRLLPRYSEEYTFYVDADDGVRLWINDVQLVERWDSGANMTAAKLSLKANTFYRIKLEYSTCMRLSKHTSSYRTQVQGQQWPRQNVFVLGVAFHRQGNHSGFATVGHFLPSKYCCAIAISYDAHKGTMKHTY